MNVIADYFLTMLPIMGIVAVITTLVRVGMYLLQRDWFPHVNLWHEVGIVFFTCWTLSLLWMALLPHEGFFAVLKGQVPLFAPFASGGLNFIPFTVIPETVQQFKDGNLAYFMVNFLGNLLMFIPFGFFAPLLWRRFEGIWSCLALGLSLSLFIECGQLFLARSSDIDDLLLNLLGTAVGYILYLLFAKLFFGFRDGCKSPSETRRRFSLY